MKILNYPRENWEKYKTPRGGGVNIEYANSYKSITIISCNIWVGSKFPDISLQGSHRSGKLKEILKTFSSQGNQGNTGGFQPKSGEKISNQGTFFPNHFQTF